MVYHPPVISWSLVEVVRGGDGLDSANWLSASESSRLAGLRFPKRRQEWLNGRRAAKELLLNSLDGLNGAIPADLSIENEPHGAPFVVFREERQEIDLTISHRDDLALCAVIQADECSIGADVEIIESRPAVFVEDYFTATEQDLVNAALTSQRDQTVTLIWSAKEAALKALKEGLRLDTRSVEILDIQPAKGEWGSYCVQAGRGSAGVMRGWWQVRGDYVLTIALLSKSGRIEDVVLEQKLKPA